MNYLARQRRDGDSLRDSYSKAIYDEKAEGLDRGMAKLEELSKAKFGELADRVVAANDAKQKYLE